MTDSVVIVASCGTDNPNRATRALFLAMAAQKEGKRATLFLLDEAVYLAKKGAAATLRAATGDDADNHLTYLQEYDVPILVCTDFTKNVDSCRGCAQDTWPAVPKTRDRSALTRLHGYSSTGRESLGTMTIRKAATDNPIPMATSTCAQVSGRTVPQ